jgi:RNA-directed DNA polymerase
VDRTNRLDVTALEQGVKGGKWYSLIDKVQLETTLKAAFTEVTANKGAAGVDHVSVERFAKDKDANLQHLSEELRRGIYRPQQIRRHYIPKPGSTEMRPLGIPTVTRPGGADGTAHGAGTDL